MEKDTYYFKTGKVVEFEKIEIPKENESLFRVNLPSSLEGFSNGVGEGVWACGNTMSIDAYTRELDGEQIYFVAILNDSFFYKGLKYGDIIPVVMRGSNRPVALFEELTNKYILISPEEKAELINNLILQNNKINLH